MILWSTRQFVLPRYSDLLHELSNLNKKWVICCRLSSSKYSKLTFCFTSRLFLESITFSGTGRTRNLSRHDPANISYGVGNQPYLHANSGGGPLVFVSTVVVSQCHLIDARINATNSRSQKLIEGACIEGEMERLVGAIGQVINQVEYKGQIQAGNISFATTFSTGDSGMV